MNTLPDQISKPPSKGAALVIVLAFVVLLTGVGVAYFSRAGTDRQLAQSSSNDTNADLLTQSALDIVVSDLKQEIVNGSTSTTINGITIYVPTTAGNMLPQRSGNPPGVPNLIRRSVRGDGIVPGSRASAVNSRTDASANSRAISSTRWNSHYLVPKKNTGTDDSEPVDAFTAATPDWVLVTRNGPVPFQTWQSDLKDATPSNGNYVVGRYAYAIYDEGGLLDVNVAGYPTGTTASQSGRKGSVAFADLTALPYPIPNGSPSPSPYQVDRLVGWRNYATTQPSNLFSATNFAANFQSDPTRAVAYFTSIINNTTGFLTVRSNPSPSPYPWNGRTDQMFLGRQELIAFRGASGFSANALQFLGTFSRELNGPTWKPSTPAGSTIDYAGLAENPTAINRDLATVRVTGPFIRADGTPAVVGEPLLKTRFPLRRINELTDTGNANIQRDFGLIWNAGQNRWDYVAATGSAIKRLDQVAAENREPNFFEMLKAVILSGSVGLGSSGANTFVMAEAKYSNADHQIIQIGANIIDAWDTDNIPSFINFGGNELAGVENLPYLSKIVYYFWLSNHGNQGDHDEWSAWLVPSLWNPHQNAASAPSDQDVRFVMTSGSVTGWLDLDGNRPTLQTPTITSTGATPYVEVKANLFATPYPPAPSNENGSPPHSPEIGPVTQGPCCYDGIILVDSIATEKQAYKHVDKSYPMFAVGTTFQMQVQTNGTWKPYQSWKSCSNGTDSPPPGVPTIYSPGRNQQGSLQDPEFVSLDPRTVRFGVWGSDADRAGNNNDYTTGLELTMDENNGGGTPQVITGLKPQPTPAFPTTGKTYLYSTNGTNGDQYADLDGVKRRGDWTTDVNGTANTKTIMYPANSADRPQSLSSPFQSFQSVAELGQVFRDQPWKTLNFTTANSGDAGLLDAFTLQDVPLIAGRTSLNTRQQGVLMAILSKAAKNLVATGIITTAQANPIATALTSLTAANPMISKGELVTRLAADLSVTSLGNKEARECVVRAFSDACQTRTWNLMVDVVAQSGRYPPNANNLAQFMVEGEQRYWLHVAIDRFTGQVIDKQIEVVNE